MPNGPLGLEHPLIVADSIDQLAERYRKLGFAPTKRGFHPWGTATQLVLFPDNFIELMGIADHDLLDKPSETGFRFGRFIARQLDRREGVAMVALHSDDAVADTAAVTARGLEPDGLVNFRRAVTLPDGAQDEAVVSLAMLIDEDRPSLSHFICQQHRPEFVWVPEWMDHPNGAEAMVGVTYAVGEPMAIWSRFARIWGEAALTEVSGGFSVATAGGELLVLDRITAEARFWQTPMPVGWRDEPCAIAITLRVRDLVATHLHMATNMQPYLHTDESVRIAPQHAGNVILEFVE